MNRENLKKANKINEEIEKLEQKIHELKILQ